MSHALIFAGLAFFLTGCGLAEAPEQSDRAIAQAGLPSRSAIVVVVDTLRADHVGVYGYSRPTSPSLDRWAAEGRVYERTYSTSSWTLPSFGSLYTGYYPMRHRAGVASRFDRPGAIIANSLHHSVPTIAERLLARDVRTGAVKNNPYLGPPFGIHRGFQTYDYEPGGLHETRRADVMVDRALAQIDRWHDDPFFLVVHLFDPHMDYDPPHSVRGTFSSDVDSEYELPFQDQSIRNRTDDLSEADWAFVRAAYDEEVLFVDQQLGRFRQGLVDRDILDRTLVVVTADHGEELNDHGGFEHGHAMWEEIVRVPLVVWGPGALPGREEGPTSLVDVAPTILDWFEVPVPDDFHGTSLLPNLMTGAAVPDRTLIVEGRLYGSDQRAIVRWPLKVVVDPENQPLRVTDLRADPLERVNLLASDRGRVTGHVDELTEQLGRLRWQARSAGPVDEPVELDQETLDRLRSLGYVR